MSDKVSSIAPPINAIAAHVTQAPPLDEHLTPFCVNEPAVQSHWSPSSLDLFQTCPTKYKYLKLERWTDKGEKDSLWFGKMYHAAIEHNTKARQAGADFSAALVATVRHVLGSTFGHRSNDTARTRETLLRAVVWYLDEYRHSPVIPLRLQSGMPALELEWELPLPLISPDGEPYILRGHFDEAASQEQGGGADGDRGDVPGTSSRVRLLIPERKTTARSLGKDYMAGWKPHNQTAAYSLAGAIVFPGNGVEILIQACQTMVGGTRFAMRPVQYSPAELQEFVVDTVEWIRTAERYAHTNYWPRNRASCNNYGGCIFREVCERDPSVRETILRDKFDKLPSVWEIAGFRKLLSYL